MRRPLLFLLVFLPTCFVAMSGSASAEPAVRYVAEDVAVDEALGGREGVVVLDVRTPAEFAAGHIDGALNIDIDDADFRARAAGLDRDRVYLVHCSANVPNGRSARAMSVMTELGFERLENLVGGYAAWTSAGGEITTGER